MLSLSGNKLNMNEPKLESSNAKLEAQYRETVREFEAFLSQHSRMKVEVNARNPLLKTVNFKSIANLLALGGKYFSKTTLIVNGIQGKGVDARINVKHLFVAIYLEKLLIESIKIDNPEMCEEEVNAKAIRISTLPPHLVTAAKSRLNSPVRFDEVLEAVKNKLASMAEFYNRTSIAPENQDWDDDEVEA